MLIWLGICGLMDLKYRKVSNLLIIIGIVVGSVELYNHQMVMQSLIGFVLPFIIVYPAFKLDGIGAADIKVMMVIGLYYGLDKSLWMFLLSFSIFTLFGLILMMIRGELVTRFKKIYYGLIIEKDIHSIKKSDKLNLPLVTFLFMGSFLYDILILTDILSYPV